MSAIAIVIEIVLTKLKIDLNTLTLIQLNKKQKKKRFNNNCVTRRLLVIVARS